MHEISQQTVTHMVWKRDHDTAISLQEIYGAFTLLQSKIYTLSFTDVSSVQMLYTGSAA